MDGNVKMTKAFTSYLTDQSVEEFLSEAYVQAVAARARVSVSTNRHDHGIDGSFRHINKINNRRSESGIALDFQLKASQKWRIDKRTNNIAYNLEAKTYNDLANYAAPCILILLCLPPDMDKWVEQCEDYLLLRKCGYYWEKENSDLTPNKNTTSILIPRTQLLTSDALLKLLERTNNRRAWR